MKKLLLVISFLLVSIILIGCNKEEKKFVEYWALDYTIEYYNQEYENYNILAYDIERLTIYDETQFENYVEDYKYKAFKITITNNSGKDKVYNVLILYSEPKFYIGAATFSEPKISENLIHDFDIEPS